MPIQTVSQAFTNEGAGGFSFRNLLHNGSFIVDQRNTTDTPITTSNYAWGADRYALAHSSDGAWSMQRVADAPFGFKYSDRVTITTADASLSSSQRLTFNYSGEYRDFSHLMWGTALAKTVTISFWVKSSVIGTYSFTARTYSAGTSYTAPYTINSANTWEYKTITIPGPTIGTWDNTDNDGFGYLIWSLGIGSNFETGANNTWTSVSNGQGRTSHVSLLSTLNATWQITGIQMEVGSVATPFEHRPYGLELSLCQRYYFKTNGVVYACGYGTSPTTNAIAEINLPSIMRTIPTVSISDSSQGSSFGYGSNNTETVYFTATPTGSGAPRANIQANSEL
jgi:hypothetical protein